MRRGEEERVPVLGLMGLFGFEIGVPKVSKTALKSEICREWNSLLLIIFLLPTLILICLPCLSGGDN